MKKKLHIEFDLPLDAHLERAWTKRPDNAKENMQFAFSQLAGTEIENLKVHEITNA